MVPFSSYCVWICYYDEVADPYIPVFCVPFLSWHEVRKNITRPSLPKWVDNFLAKLNSVAWVIRVAKWTLGNSVCGSAQQDVIWTKISAIVGIIFGFCQLVVHLPDLPLQVNRYTARRAWARRLQWFSLGLTWPLNQNIHIVVWGKGGSELPLRIILWAWLCPNLQPLGVVLALLHHLRTIVWNHHLWVTTVSKESS